MNDVAIRDLGEEARIRLAQRSLDDDPLLQLAEKLRNEKDRSIHEDPRRDDAVMKNDLVYKLGYIAALDELLAAPRRARVMED
jgi:hypothetical protein